MNNKILELITRCHQLDLQAKKIHFLFEEAAQSELLALAEILGAETTKLLEETNIDWSCCGNLGRHLTFLVRYLKKGEKQRCRQDISDIMYFDLPKLFNHLLLLLSENQVPDTLSRPQIHPKVFISYSHSTNDHKQWVLKLGENLRYSGVDVILDQWDLGFGNDIATFMERSIAVSDRVLVICSETYNHKVKHNAGGVAYEKLLVTAELVKEVGSNKFIPVVPPTDRINAYGIPSFLSGRLHIDLSNDHGFNTIEFQNLIKELHGIPIQEKPALGPVPFSLS